jgi:hypothetical protein
MPSGAGNTFSYKLSDGSIILIPDLTGVLPVYQGQIAVWDATLNGGNGGVRAASTQADIANFIGVAEQNSILNSLLEQLPTVRVGFQGVYYLNTTAAEVYKYGTKVFFNESIAGALQVTSNTNAGARTIAVGYVILPNQTMLAGITTVTGAAGVQIPVAIIGQWPVVGLA